MRDLLNTTIITKSDVTRHSKLPIIGEIDSKPKGGSLVVEHHSRTNISEQFRDLRTHLQIVLKNKSNVILVTSSMKKEGKSFVTLNLASVLGLGGKKVVMIELDLRNPRLSESLEMSNDYGFADFVLSDKTNFDDIIRPTAFSKNVFIISSGNIPVNPSEILLSHKLGELITALKEKYDHIIIDSPPVGLISDALLIEKYTDANLYITRLGYTHKSQLRIVNDLVDTLKFKDTYLVINDIKNRKSSYYGHASGNRYGYPYYNDKEKKK